MDGLTGILKMIQVLNNLHSYAQTISLWYKRMAHEYSSYEELQSEAIQAYLYRYNDALSKPASLCKGL
jgi:hypothetical protein